MQSVFVDDVGRKKKTQSLHCRFYSINNNCVEFNFNLGTTKHWKHSRKSNLLRQKEEYKPF